MARSGQRAGAGGKTGNVADAKKRTEPHTLSQSEAPFFALGEKRGGTRPNVTITLDRFF